MYTTNSQKKKVKSVVIRLWKTTIPGVCCELEKKSVLKSRFQAMTHLKFVTFSFCFLLSLISQGQTTRFASNYTELVNAVSASVDNDAIDITNNIVVTAEVALNKTITINGNGYYITVPVNGISDAGIQNTLPSAFRVFNHNAAGKTITINNLTIKGGNIVGSCLQITNGVARLNNVTISNGRGGSAGGISNAGTLYLTNCLVSRNSAGFAGGILNSSTGKTYITNSTFVENRTENPAGGGGAAENNGIMYINNCTFSNNKSTEIGGAINNKNGALWIINSTFSGNIGYGATTAGGAIGMNRGTVYLLNNIFAFNYVRSAGTVTDPSAFTLDDVSKYSASTINSYYNIFHTSTAAHTIAINNVAYTGTADGTDNTIFTNGIYTRIRNGVGTEIGTGQIFQPFIIKSGDGTTATLQPGSFVLATPNRGTKTGYSNITTPETVGYFNGSSWVTLQGTNPQNYEVTTDQLGATRANPTARGSVEKVLSNYYMLKINSSTDGSFSGGSVYGDTYPSGTSLTVTAFPNSGKKFVRWDYVLGGTGIASTSNPYTLTLTQNTTLVPVFAAATGGSYTITYLGNENTSGTVPAPQTANSPTTVASKGDLSRVGYVFNNWNTAYNGSGTPYSENQAYSGGTNVTLYAQWKPICPSDISIPAFTYAGSPYCNSVKNGGVATVTLVNNSGVAGTFSNGSGLAINPTTGDIKLTSAPVSPTTHTITYTVPAARGCAAYAPTTEVIININAFHVTGNWSNGGNWVCGFDPDPADSVVIDINVIATLDKDFVVDNSLRIKNGSSLIIGSGSDLSVNGIANFNNKHVIVRSDANGTGSIGNSPGTIKGATMVTVERYIPKNTNRAWRLLSFPTRGQTLHESWQEGQATAANDNKGYGTIITSNQENWKDSGYDYRTPGNSLLQYDPANDKLLGVTTTKGDTATRSGYFIYIRGDRSIGPSASIDAGSATTLRSTGRIYKGAYGVTVSKGKSALIGNIYPSSIDLRRLQIDEGIEKNFAIWDPKLDGTYHLGAYQYLTMNPAGDSYIISPGGGSYGDAGSEENIIQSGMAFFATATAKGRVTFTEDAKSPENTSTVFSVPTNKMFATSLYAVTPEGMHLADGALQLFDESFSNSVDALDTKKRDNFGENLFLTHLQKNLAIEKRQLFKDKDTIFLGINNLRAKTSYQFVFKPTDIGDLNLSAVLEDSYTKQITPVSLSSNTTVSFSVDNNAAASAANRFHIVFTSNGVLAILFTDVKAFAQQDRVTVEWDVENQAGINNYVIERSVNGIDFTEAGTVTANTASVSTYQWDDKSPAAGNNYYRVVSVLSDGTRSYSQVVTVVFTGTIAISIINNPVTNGVIRLSLGTMPAGKYSIRLIVSNGAVLLSKQSDYDGLTTTVPITLPPAIATGIYMLEIIAPDKSKTIQKVLIAR